MPKHSFAGLSVALSLLVPAAVSQEAKGALAQKLDASVPALLEKFNEPGVAVALMYECGAATIHVYGLADRQRGLAMQRDTVFGLQSVSKTFTAWAVMQLVNEGRIKMDEPVDAYLKRWHIPESAFDARRVTVRRLLSHSAGISLPSVSSAGPDAEPAALLAELKSAVKLARAPGEAYEYSGGGYAVLQLMVEDVTGRPFAEYAERTVLRKLGMKSSGFSWTPELAQRAATPHEANGNVHPRQRFSAVAAAGMVSTAADMGLFLRAHCQADPIGGGVMTAQKLDEMLTPVAVTAAAGERPMPRFGLGYMLYPARDLALAGHSGSGAGWTSQFLVIPKLGAGIAVLSNSEGGQTRNAILRMFRDAILANPAR